MTTTPTSICNVAAGLAEWADRTPDQPAIIAQRRRDASGRWLYDQVTFRELDQDSDRLALGLQHLGARPGMRMALLVRPGIDFISLVFAMFKAGLVSILIDPGMGKKNALRSLADAEPDGFVAIPAAQLARLLNRRKFAKAKLNVTVGRRWLWGGPTLDSLRQGGWAGRQLAATSADDPAAIIFTTGSTGPSKGVLYRHGNFAHQVSEIRDAYDIRPGEIDVAAFPLFGLFNAAMGVTTIVPAMDASRPARVDPANIVAAVLDHRATQSFASPAVWNRVGPYCAANSLRMPSLRRVLSAGAPVPPRVLESMKACIHPDGEVHTPYGATEALPIATIAASEVLGETKAIWARGGGTCVGRRFRDITWRVIPIVDGPIVTLQEAGELPPGEIGELIVTGPVVTREYVTRVEANVTGKIIDGSTIWHRMGDVGYLDDQDRFWFCGRMAHRVTTSGGPMFTIPCEAIFNQHAAVHRSALVGVGPAGNQRPVMICEPFRDRFPKDALGLGMLVDELRALAAEHAHTRPIHDFLVHKSFPVDIRHNAKIFREKLAVWAAEQLKS